MRITLPFLGVLGMLIYSNNAFAQKTITISSPGANSISIYRPASLTADAWGAGGSGIGNRGAGGGGGGYSRKVYASLTQSSFPYSVGAGTVNSTGGITWFISATSTDLLARGGIAATAGAAGTGGTIGFGDLTRIGGNGFRPMSGNSGGGGGSSAGTGANGVIALTATGATAPIGGGNGGAGGGNNANGTLGSPPGGGGGGGGNGTTSGAAGGNGNLILTWNCSSALTSGNPNPAPVCLGTGIGPIVYDFFGASGYSINWAPSVPAGINVVNNDGTITISGVPTVANNYSYTISPEYPVGSTGTCTGAGSFTGSFTVNPNNSAGTISSNTFCTLSPLPGGITQSTTGATGINAVGATGLPPGVTVAWAANQITFSGTPTTPGTYNYSIPMTGGCGAINATGTITVNATPAISSQVTPGGTTCINSTAFGQMSVGTGFGYTYQWFSNTANNNTTGTAIPLATTNTYTPLNTTVGTLYYYVVVGSPSCTSAASPVSGAYVVNANNTVSAPSATPTVCASSLITAITHTTTGATGIGTVIGLPIGLTASWAANTITISGTPTQTGVFNYTIPLTGGCSTVNATGTITVNAVPAITSQVTPGGTTCINSTAFGQMSVGTGFGYTYQWFSNTANNNTTGTAIPLATTNTYTPLNTTAGTLYYYMVVGSTSCTSVTSPVSGAYIVNPNNTVSAPSATPTVCASSLITPITHTTTGAAGIGTVSGLPTGLTASWAANTITISGTPTQTGVFNYTIPLTGGCSSVNATGTITVNAQAAIITPSLATQSRCINTAFAPISVGTGFGLTYQWFSNSANNNTTGTSIPATSNSYTPLSNTAGTTYYYVVVTSATCATTATSSPSGAFIVNPLPVVSFVSQPAVGNYCVDTDITYSTQAGESNYVWIIPGTLGTDYTITSGGNGSPSLVVRWLTTTGSKSVSVNYTDAQSCGATTPATSNTITIQKNTFNPPSNPNPSSCFIDRNAVPANSFTSFTHLTTLANAIGAPSGLPLGLTAGFSGNTITISGTIAASVPPGIYNYTIPLLGGCGDVSVTGFIDVQPEYKLTSISSVSPSSTGGVATITIEGSPALFPNGSYVLTYSLGLSNAGSETRTVTFTNGKAVFTTIPIASEDLTSLTISQIRKSTDACFVPVTENNVTFFGIKAATFTTSGTFFVPAGIFEITIKVWGGGGGGGNDTNGAGGGGGGFSVVTIPVTPGEPIGIFIGQGGNAQTFGGDSWATRDSSPPNAISNSLVYAKGGARAIGPTPGAHNAALPNLTSPGWGNSAAGVNGQAGNGGNGGKGGGATGGAGGAGGSASGNDTGKPGFAPGGGGGGSKGNSLGGRGGNGLVLISFPLPPTGPCFKVIDDGAITGTTIIEYTCENQTWTAPEGLIEFSTFVGGGGGGGGVGEAAGGGGAGGLVSSTIPSGSPIGFPANSTFTINAGPGGAGATSPNVRGTNGNPSNISGTVNSSTISFTAGGGGGGGSEFAITSGNGTNGASGGGGGANNSSEGLGGTGNGSGKAGGAGDFSTGQAFAGGGGGGIVEIGGEGKGAGLGQGEGGKGGNGVAIVMGDSTRYFGAGGGGVGFNFNGTDKIGFGGSINGIKFGGDGSLVGSGFQGVDKTGSGGGSGAATGGRGGNGVVYIYYFNYRILPVEFLYFNAIYQNSSRSGELKWATAKEWETSHFEIERSVNDTRNWTKVGEVTGKGYSDVPVEYSFTDLNLPASGGNIFYRLKQVDLKGDFQNSLTRAIQVEGLEGSTSWIAYPNPSAMRSSITVDLLDRSGYADESILIRISDARGIFESYSVSSPDEVSAVVNSYFEEARPGLHILQLFWGDQSEVIKLIRR